MPKPLYVGKITEKTSIVENVLTDRINKKIQSLIDAHLIYDGQVSKRHYEWMKAGAVVDVDELDVPELLSKRLGGKSCCGGGDGNQIFQLAI